MAWEDFQAGWEEAFEDFDKKNVIVLQNLESLADCKCAAVYKSLPWSNS